MFESKPKDSFDTEQLYNFAIEKIAQFAQEHSDEVFYGFCIDAGSLCLNSIEKLYITAVEYEASQLTRARNNPILAHIDDQAKRRFLEGCQRNAKSVSEFQTELKFSIGDWAYQGFADMTNLPGFDEPSYLRHYDFVIGLEVPKEALDGPASLFIPDRANDTAYARAMDSLLKRISDSGIFHLLRKTDDFSAFRVEHLY